MSGLEIHPMADRLPSMPKDQYEKFKEDIAGLGVLEPIILLEGKILDGRHRYRACQELGIECPTKTVEFLSPNDLVRSMNLYRRHLNGSQRAMVAAQLLEPFEREAKEEQEKGHIKGGETAGRSRPKDKNSIKENFPESKPRMQATDKAGEALGVSGRSVRDAKVVADEGTAEEIKSVTTGKVAVSTTAKKVRERRPPKKKQQGKMNETNENIGWAAYSWNPVSGCKHGCPYCYAASMTKRYGNSFEPQFHEERLSYPAHTKIKGGRNNRVFTCSMGELFGPWVPEEWIDKVLDSVKDNPEWTFLFLTKSPERLPDIDWPDNAWIGSTIDTQARVDSVTESFDLLSHNAPSNIRFISCEPLLEEVILPHELLQVLDWLIIGAKSEGQTKVQPDSKWVESLFMQAREYNIHVWFKDNLIFRPQEIPELR